MTSEEQKIVKFAQELADRFVHKCETGRARSIETQADCRKLLKMIDKYEKGKEEKMKEQTPLHQHDCENCVFLGTVEEHYDLYFCPQGGRPTVIARFGNDPWEYKSGLSSLDHDRVLKKAYLLAKNEGLIKGVQHDGRRP